jgi:DNA transformation protein
MVSDLTLLPNIGPVLADKLNRIGVTNFEELEATGSVEAVIRIGVTDEAACYNMLYALEGAICGVRWHALSKNEREKIKIEFKLAVGT